MLSESRYRKNHCCLVVLSLLRPYRCEGTETLLLSCLSFFRPLRSEKVTVFVKRGLTAPGVSVCLKRAVAPEVPFVWCRELISIKKGREAWQLPASYTFCEGFLVTSLVVTFSAQC